MMQKYAKRCVKLNFSVKIFPLGLFFFVLDKVKVEVRSDGHVIRNLYINEMVVLQPFGMTFFEKLHERQPGIGYIRRMVLFSDYHYTISGSFSHNFLNPV